MGEGPPRAPETSAGAQTGLTWPACCGNSHTWWHAGDAVRCCHVHHHRRPQRLPAGGWPGAWGVGRLRAVLCPGAAPWGGASGTVQVGRCSALVREVLGVGSGLCASGQFRVTGPGAAAGSRWPRGPEDLLGGPALLHVPHLPPKRRQSEGWGPSPAAWLAPSSGQLYTLWSLFWHKGDSGHCGHLSAG